MGLLRNLFKHKLNRDIGWTLGSFSILAVSGIIINLVITGFRDASALGVFNQSYAIYVIASQVAAFGFHYSVLRHAAYYESDVAERGAMFLTGIVATVILGIGSALSVYALAPLLGGLFDSVATGKAIQYSAAGLLLFPLNKVLIAYLNGLRLMKAFSILQATRYLVVMVSVSSIALSNYPFEFATLGFFLAELVTACAALVYLYRRRLLVALCFNFRWLIRHFKFGGKSLLAGMFVEMNSRIDVLLIGVFLSDRAVGIYSFAAMLVDGLYHVMAMIRINFNPVLVSALRDRQWTAAQLLLRRSKRYGYPITVILSTLVIAVFWLLAVQLIPEKGLLEGLPSLVILLTGLTLISVFLPFEHLLMVSGHPGYQTLQHMTVVFANVILNISLVPILGISGAAIATAFSYLVGLSVLILLVNRFLRWNLITNQIKQQ